VLRSEGCFEGWFFAVFFFFFGGGVCLDAGMGKKEK
jgi:hypothetical protein